MKKIINKVSAFLDRYEIINFGKNNKTFIFLILCMIFGMVLGAVSVGTISMEIIHKLDFLFLNDFKERIQSSGFDIFISSFSSLVIFAIIIEMCALSFWGSAFIPFINFFRGLGLGITSGYLYLIYGLKGIAFYILILLPGIFISSIGMIIFSAESMKFSVKFAGKILPSGNCDSLWDELKKHMKSCGYCMVILLVSSLIDMGFMAMFSRFFEF